MTQYLDFKVRGRRGDFALDMAMRAPLQGVTAIHGPSGGGKSTLLRVLAGLERFENAHVVIGDEIWQSETGFVPAHQRSIGMVFQDARLFAHLSVIENLEFGWKRVGAKDAIPKDAVIDILDLSGLLTRQTHKLSGGERQRVAIGRALLSQPKLILMDEPISALDSESRESILPYFRRLQTQLAIPMLYVSHDMDEVERLADWLVLVEQGQVVRSDKLQALQSSFDLHLFRRRDAAVTLMGKITERDLEYGLVELTVAGGHLWAPFAGRNSDRPVRIQIRASDVSVSVEPPSTTSILNQLPAHIDQVSHTSNFEVVARLRLGEDGEGETILARMTRKSWDALKLEPGKSVFAQIKGVALAE